jgi:Ca2+-dependent lipid-binding protein
MKNLFGSSKNLKTTVTENELEKSYNIALEQYKRQPGDLKLSMQVIECKNLLPTDVFGKSNPYVCLYVLGEVHPRSKTKVVKKTTNPQWNEMMEA